MKKKLLLLTIILIAIFNTNAQVFKIAKSSGRLFINLPGATIEGYDGKEIIFTSLDSNEEKDERAAGLKQISGTATYEDNTGIGINVTDKGNTVEVNVAGKKKIEGLVIKVPKNMPVSFVYEKDINAGEVIFRKMESEIEVSVQYNTVKLDSVTGPMNIKTVYGGIEASFTTTIKGPVSILSVYGFIDISLPLTTKAQINFSTSYGQIYAASDFKIAMEKPDTEALSYGDQVKGKINGGGIDIVLKSNYGKIYLRKLK
jgi:hypothetical protein